MYKRQAQGRPGFDSTRFQWLLKFDLCLHEKPRKLPQWLTVDLTGGERERIIAFYQKEAQTRQYLSAYPELDSKALARVSHLEIFPDQTVLLFDYSRKDILGNAQYRDITAVSYTHLDVYKRQAPAHPHVCTSRTSRRCVD